MKLYFTLLSLALVCLLTGQDCNNLQIDLPEEVVLCEPGQLTLPAQVMGGADEISWTPLTGLVNPQSANTIAEITGDISYTLTARRVSEVELITNGDFSQGDTGFSSDYIYATGGGSGPLSNSGQYAIAANARDTHRQFARCRDRSGNGNIMVVNASGDPSNVWCQTITVEPATSYRFSAWVTSVVSENPAQLQFAVNGSLLETPFNASPNTCSWQNFSAEWQSGSTTSAEICISNTNFTPVGNDFALDDISFRAVCEATASIDIRIANLTPDFTIATELCGNEPAFNPADLLNPGSTPDGTWVLDGIPVTEILAASLSPGPHQLRYILQDGSCREEASANFTIIPAPNAGTFVGDTPACYTAGEVLTLGTLLNGADPGGSWIQTSGPSPAVFDPSSGNITLGEAGSYTFTYELSNSGNCGTDTESVTVNRTPLPVVDLEPALTLDCNFPSIELGGGSTSTGPGFTYSWDRDGIPLAPNAAIFEASAPGNYTLTVRDADGCTASANSTVTDQRVELTVEAEALQAPCDDPKGGGIQITDIVGGEAPYLTSLNDSPFAMIESYPDLAAGNYEIRVQDAGGCEGTLDLQLFEPVQPTLMLTAPEQEEPLTLGDALSIRALTSVTPASIDTLFWSPSISDSLSTGFLRWRITPLETTTYTLTIIDQNGCTVQADIFVPVARDGNVFVPNAISPNQDGSNDCLIVYDAGSVAQILELQIFNRWGSQIYQSNTLVTNSESGAWDGTFAGQRLPADVYVYQLTVQWISGEIGQLSGEVHLVY